MKNLTLVDKAFHLKKTALFQGLDLDLLLPIADKLGLSKFDQSACIFEMGEPAYLMYFIVNGSVSVERDPSPPLQLEEGKFFGDRELFSGDPRNSTVKTTNGVSTLTLSRPDLHSIIAECPSVALAFLKAYTKTSRGGKS